MACAQTGSGKAAAFCSPIIVGIMRNTGLSSWWPHSFSIGINPFTYMGTILSDNHEAKKFTYQIGIMIVVAYRHAPVQQSQVGHKVQASKLWSKWICHPSAGVN